MNIVVISERNAAACYKQAAALYHKYGDELFQKGIEEWAEEEKTSVFLLLKIEKWFGPISFPPQFLYPLFRPQRGKLFFKKNYQFVIVKKKVL